MDNQRASFVTYKVAIQRNTDHTLSLQSSSNNPALGGMHYAELPSLSDRRDKLCRDVSAQKSNHVS